MGKAMKNALITAGVVIIAIMLIAVYSLVGAEQAPQKLMGARDLQPAVSSDAVQPAAVVPANFDMVVSGSTLQGQ